MVMVALKRDDVQRLEDQTQSRLSFNYSFVCWWLFALICLEGTLLLKVYGKLGSSHSEGNVTLLFVIFTCKYRCKS